MEGYFKAVAAALITAVLGVVLTKHSKDSAMLLTLLACTMILSVGAGYLSSALRFFETLEELIGGNADHFRILLKVVGVSMAGEMASMVCNDAGNSALGKALQILGTVLILCLSLPLFQGLLDLIGTILEGV